MNMILACSFAKTYLPVHEQNCLSVFPLCETWVPTWLVPSKAAWPTFNPQFDTVNLRLLSRFQLLFQDDLKTLINLGLRLWSVDDLSCFHTNSLWRWFHGVTLLLLRCFWIYLFLILYQVVCNCVWQVHGHLRIMWFSNYDFVRW